MNKIKFNSIIKKNIFNNKNLKKFIKKFKKFFKLKKLKIYIQDIGKYLNIQLVKVKLKIYSVKLLIINFHKMIKFQKYIN